MKAFIIQTKVIVPKAERWYRSSKSEDFKTFVESMRRFLSIPESGYEFVKFEETSEYITLQEEWNGSNRRRIFRKFKRGQEATITNEQLTDFQNYIANKIEEQKNRDEKMNDYEVFLPTLNQIIELHISESFEYSYNENNKSLKVTLKDNPFMGNDRTYKSEVGFCYIGRDGIVSEPKFRHYDFESSKYHTLEDYKLIFDKVASFRETILEQSRLVLATLETILPTYFNY